MIVKLCILIAAIVIFVDQTIACHKKRCCKAKKPKCGGGHSKCAPSCAPCGGGGAYISEPDWQLEAVGSYAAAPAPIVSYGGDTYQYAAPAQQHQYAPAAAQKGGSSYNSGGQATGGYKSGGGADPFGGWQTDTVSQYEEIKPAQSDVKIFEAQQGGDDQMFHLVPLDVTGLNLEELARQSDEPAADASPNRDYSVHLEPVRNEVLNNLGRADTPKAPSPPVSNALPEIPDDLPFPLGPDDDIPPELQEILRQQGPPPQFPGDLPSDARSFKASSRSFGGFPRANERNRDRGRLREGLRARLEELRSGRSRKM